MGVLEKIPGWVMRVTDKIFEFERPATPGEQIVFRAFEWFIVGGLCLFTWTWAIDIGRMDGSGFQEWSARYADSLLDGRALALGNAALISLLLGLGLLGRWDRYAYLVALPLIHLQFTGRYSPGAGLHHSHLVGMCLLAIGLAFFLFESKPLRLRFALGATYVFVGLGYFLAALSKIRQSGWDWAVGNNLQMWISANQVHRISKDQSFGLNEVQELVMSHAAIATLVMAPSLLIELLGLSMCVRRIRMYYASAVILMHLGIAVIMGIYFTWNIALLLVIGFPWHALVDRIRTRELAVDATGGAPRSLRRT